MPKRTVKRGRRPGAPPTRESIRHHAAEAFARAGFAGVTVREIAAAAGVDAALVHHYFGSKRALFEAAAGRVDLAVIAPVSTPRGTPGDEETAGSRIVREFVSTWDPAAHRVTLAGLIRAAASDAEARETVAALVARTIVVPAIAGIDARRGMARLRASLVAAQLLGLAWLRYVLESEPSASASPRLLARTFGPSIDATLFGSDYRAAR